MTLAMKMQLFAVDLKEKTIVCRRCGEKSPTVYTDVFTQSNLETQMERKIDRSKVHYPPQG